MNINNYIFSYDKELKNKLINEILELSKNNDSYLLNTNKDNFTILEKYIFDLIQFYQNKNKDNINFIEFWCKSCINISTVHVDGDEYLKKNNEFSYPLKSLVSYFNDNNNPTLITNIDREKYLYKKFEDEDSIIFSLPRENKVLIFDGNKYHGVNFKNENGKKEERIIIAVNIWDKKPEHINYYNNKNINYNKNDDIFTFLENFKIDTINVNNLINYDLFDNICYQSKNVYPLFLDYIHNNCSNYIFKKNKKNNQNLDILLRNKYGKLIDDINFMLNNTQKINRFYQRFHIKNVITPEIGKWIIEESEEYAFNFGWTTQRHNNYPTTDIEVKNIKSVLRFFNILFNHKIKNIIRKSYNLNNDVEFNINDIFVVKYNEKQQSFLEMHNDGTFLSFNILLNSQNDFEGGGTMFEDGIIMNSNCGDLLLHSSLIKHSGLQVYKGTRYVLVCFLDLNLFP